MSRTGWARRRARRRSAARQISFLRTTRTPFSAGTGELCRRSTTSLPGVAHAGGDAVDRHHERMPELRVDVVALAQPPEELDLDQIDGIDVRVADVDRSPQDWIVRDQPVAPAGLEQSADRGIEATSEVHSDRHEIFGYELPVVLRGDVRVRLGKDHLNQPKRRAEERPVAVHPRDHVSLAAIEG